MHQVAGATDSLYPPGLRTKNYEMRPHDEEDAPDFSPADLVDALRRRKWSILVTIIVTAMIGAASAFAMPRTYVTAALLMVESPSGVIVNEVNGNDALAPLMVLKQNGSIKSQIAILRTAL